MGAFFRGFSDELRKLGFMNQMGPLAGSRQPIARLPLSMARPTSPPNPLGGGPR